MSQTVQDSAAAVMATMAVLFHDVLLEGRLGGETRHDVRAHAAVQAEPPLVQLRPSPEEASRRTQDGVYRFRVLTI